ncbi:MAG TPA: cytochrome c nitrite reductase small subunit [Gemmatimonadaceae bacterium]|nr:cytochrome c nitrite reductase small subunit [Gemmatimonadaceae bacterium]
MARRSRARRIPLIIAITIGLAVGLGAFTFVYARGYSYLTNDPAACANCHIMREHFDAWTKSTHRAVATCNDCHTPHDVVGKYVVKAKNGFWHSFYFTTGRYPDPLRITEGNRGVTEAACRHCHAEITHAIDPVPADDDGVEGHDRAARTGEPIRCVRCHRYVGHLVR